MKLWQGEQWYMQVDSHCRFVEGWDERLIALMDETGSALPILTTYGTAFVPGEDEVLSGDPLMIAFTNFAKDGIPELKPEVLPDWRKRTSPMRGRFLAAGFLFTVGSFVEQVPYDPELYFYGEEASMSVRAFTSGYDLFHPCETIVWHDYIRADAARHWHNHTRLNKVERDWSELDTFSRRKVRRLLTGRPVSGYGMGSVRTIGDFESYAGVDFKVRKLQDYTRRSKEPPNPPADPHWTDEIYLWMARIRINFLSLPDGALGDPAFWYVGIADKDHTEIYRRDFPQSELETVSGEEDEILLICEFQSGTIPETWVLQPFSRTAGWLGKIGGTFSDGDYAIITDEEDEDEDLHLDEIQDDRGGDSEARSFEAGP